MESLAAHLLVAVPQLPDENFFRSVVLMIQHDLEGAFGLVLNRPSSMSIRDVWKQVGDSPCDCEAPLHVGGPVEGPLIAIHANKPFSEREVLPGVHFASQMPNLDSIVRDESQPFMLFGGYSGWAGGQLDAEMQAGGWLETPATRDYVFGEFDDLWNTVAADIGFDVMGGHLRKGQLPDDPSMN